MTAVVLDTQPTADVTIPVSSSDTTEGTVDVTSVTFTPDELEYPATDLGQRRGRR